jgi:glycosyltransferase involved in cell wall biosynthesis
MKISIVTAAYNSAGTIADTIKSVLSQTHADWEHIIVDGASTDATVEIVKSFSDRYNGRLRLISEPDHGIYDAMNKGLAAASGDIIGILNSDDFFTRNNVLQRIVDAFNSDANIDAVYGDIMYTDPTDTSRIVRYYSSDAFRRWKMRMGFMPAHPSFYCRRQLYETHGDFDTSFKVAADFENLLRIIYVGKARCKYLPMNFVTMRSGGASTSGLTSHRSILNDHIRAYRKNHVRSGYMFDLLRYPYKVAELVSFRLHSHRNG